jgi:hypothetical protein
MWNKLVLNIITNILLPYMNAHKHSVTQMANTTEYWIAKSLSIDITRQSK